jgi:hypothetical protein
MTNRNVFDLESIKASDAFKRVDAQAQAIVDALLGNHTVITAIIKVFDERMETLHKESEVRSDSLQTIWLS